MGAFPPDFGPEGVLQLADASLEGAAGAGGAAAEAARRSATEAALEGVLNRVRPLTAHRQPSDRAPQPHGIQPLVVGSPMLDERQVHAAMRVIYSAVTRGEGRGLWLPLAVGAPPGGSMGPNGGDGVAQPLAVLSAPQATEAGLVQALQLVIGGQQDYTNIFGAGASLGRGGEPPLPRISASGDGADSAGPGLGGASRGPSRATSRRLASGLPSLPAAVRAELQVGPAFGRAWPVVAPFSF
jgi:hypothetical protein